MTTYDPVSGTESAYPVINIVSMMAWGLGYFGMPHILLRFMAIEDEKKLSLSRRVATTWVVISLAVAVLIGVIGLGMTEAGKLEMLQGSNSETIIVKIADLLSTVWCSSGTAWWYDPCGNPCIYHVYCRFYSFWQHLQQYLLTFSEVS